MRSGCLFSFLAPFLAPARPAVDYFVVESLLTPAERSFYGVLMTSLPRPLVVCCKVRLGDLVLVRPSTWSTRARIDRKHVDFVLCDPSTMRPLLAIELDDSSHKRRDRVERDEFVDGVFFAAGLKLFRVPARRSYDPQVLRREIEGAIRNPAR